MGRLEKLKSFLEEKLDFFKKVEDSEDEDEEKKYEAKIAKKMGEEHAKKFREASERTKRKAEDEKYASKLEKKMGKGAGKKFLEASRRSEQDTKGVPKQDGSGEGKRKNKGRGECEEEEQEEEGKGKKDMNITNDFIRTDFQVINDSALGGYVVRDGPYQYGIKENGEPIIRYKKWDNLQEAYGSLSTVMGYGSRYNDSHYEADDRMIGYWDNFKLIPKGEKGPTPPYIDNEHNRVWAKLNTIQDIDKLSDLELENLKNLPVSASYEDLGDDQTQVVGKVYHIATSLNKTEQDRCSTMGGSSCNISPLGDLTNHDQNLKGAISTHDFDDNNNGVLRAANKEPPTNKKINDAIMGKDKKKKPEDTIEEDAMKTNDEGEAPPYEKEKKEPLLEEEDEQNPKQAKKKKDTVEIPIETYEDLIKRMEDMETNAKKNEPLLSKIAKETESKDAKDFEDLQEVLQKEPYEVSKEKIEGKDLAWLRDKKDFLDSLPMIKDFYENEPITHEDVNKHLFDFEPIQDDPVGEIFNKTQMRTKRTLDFLAGGSDD